MFFSFWLQDDLVKVWNVADHVSCKAETILDLTTNGLERYKRHFNGICPTSHPNLVTFAHVLLVEVDRNVQLMDDVAKGREILPSYNDPVFMGIPPDIFDTNNVG